MLHRKQSFQSIRSQAELGSEALRSRSVGYTPTYYACPYADQNRRAIVVADASGGYRTQNVGDFFSLYYSRMGKIVVAAEQATKKAKGKT